MDMKRQLPEGVLSHVNAQEIDYVCEGRVSNHILRGRLKSGAPAFIKFGAQRAAHDVREEADRLRWLAGRAAAPALIYDENEADKAWTVIAELPGVAAHEALRGTTEDRLVQITAEALRGVHEIPTEDCPFRDVVEHELVLARRHCQAGLIDTAGFIKETGREPIEVLNALDARQGIVDDLVFTHGDYALPNVVVDGDALSGVIDWSQAGVAPRHRDFMCIEKSIRRNLGEQWVPAFYEAYEADGVDPQQIVFFWELDQFAAYGP